MRMELVIAGASFPCGIRELGDVARWNGFEPIFLEHPHNTAAAASGLSPLLLDDCVPESLIGRSGLLLPLLESWVSAGLRMPEHTSLRFDRTAGAISRSKRFLSETLAIAQLPYVKRATVASLADASRTASVWGYPVVLRPDRGYSGRGVWVAKSPADLRDSWLRQSEERTGVGFQEMRTFLDSRDDVLILEPWLSGEEWSMDCIVGPGGTFIIRVCEKATTVVAGRPVTLGYRICDEPLLVEELAEAARRWCRVLFGGDVVSFACFDVRRSVDGDLVPLDFSPRLGWDGIPHLVLRSGRKTNAYAAALDAVLSGDSGRLAPLPAGFALIHVFAQKPGKLGNIIPTRGGEVIVRRPHGFVIEEIEGSSPCQRIGSVLARYDSRAQFSRAAETSSSWIQVEIQRLD